MRLISDIPRVIMLSGDVHMSEILKNTCNKYLSYEVTASGMTHTIATTAGYLSNLYIYGWLPFTYNIGHRILHKNFGFIEIDWYNQTLNLSIRDSFGEISLAEQVSFSSLSTPITKKNEYCDIPESHRKNMHVLSFCLVFYVPLCINLITLVLYIRKLSHLY